MRIVVIVLALFLWAVPALGAKACAVPDFDVKGFGITVFDECKGRSCPRFKIVGEIVNNCMYAAGAQIQIVARDEGGQVVDTYEGWPASIRNIGPGQTYPFSSSVYIDYDDRAKKFSISIIDVRQW